MKTVARIGLSSLAAVLALGMLSIGASAQDTKPAVKPAAPAAAPAAPAAPSAKKAPSPCKGLEKAACTAKSECRWVEPKKAGKDGKKRDPYCRLQAKKKLDKADKKKKKAE